MQSLQNIMSSCSLGPEAAKAVAWPAAMGSPSAAAASCRPPPPPPGADPAQAALILLLAVKVTSRASAPGQTAALLQDVVKQLEAGVGAAEILKRLAAHKEDSAADSTTTTPLPNGAPQSCDDKEVSPAKNADLSNIISSLVTSAQNMLTAVQQQQPPSQHVPVSRPSCSEPTGGESKKKRDPQLMDMLYKSFQARMKNGIYNPDRNGRTRQFNHSRASPPKSAAPTTQVSGGHHNRPFCPKPIQGAKPTAAMVSPAAAASPTIPAASQTAYPAPMIQQSQAAPTLMVPQQQPSAAAQTNAAVFAQIQQQIAAAAAAASNPYTLHQQAAISAAAQQQPPPPAAYLTTNSLYQMPNPSAAAAAAMASNTFLSQQNAAAAQQLMWQQAAASQWQQQHSIQTQSQVPQHPPAQPEQQQQDAISAAAAAAAAAAAQTNGYYGAAYLLAGSKRKYELEQQHPSPSHEEAVKKLKLVHHHHHHPQPSAVNPGTIADMAASAAMYATTYT